MSSENKGHRYYRPELDAVRFLAFLLVCLHHDLPDGNDPRLARYSELCKAIVDAIAKLDSFGLRLFFALSAFLICELLVRERETTGTVRIGRFYLRRILRIWPLYYLGLALGALFVFLPGGSYGDLHALVWFSAFLGCWWGILGRAVVGPFRALWSISVEEHFYLLIPTVIKYTGRRTLFVIASSLILAANGWLFVLASKVVSDLRIWNDLLVNFQAFACGMLLCLLLHSRAPSFSSVVRIFLLAGAAFCWFIATFGLHVRFHALPYPGVGQIMAGYALADLGTVLILLAFLGIPPGWVPQWAIYLGRISYGLYVFHDFAQDLVGRALIGHRLSRHIAFNPLRMAASGGFDLFLTLVITIGAASLSYRYFESIFLRMKRRYTTIASGAGEG